VHDTALVNAEARPTSTHPACHRPPPGRARGQRPRRIRSDRLQVARPPACRRRRRPDRPAQHRPRLRPHVRRVEPQRPAVSLAGAERPAQKDRPAPRRRRLANPRPRQPRTPPSPGRHPGRLRIRTRRRGHAWHDALTDLGATPRFTRRYRPQTNGKAERFHRTMATQGPSPAAKTARTPYPAGHPTTIEPTPRSEANHPSAESTTVLVTTASAGRRARGTRPGRRRSARGPAAPSRRGGARPSRGRPPPGSRSPRRRGRPARLP
jgi:hypothetical protein